MKQGLSKAVLALGGLNAAALDAVSSITRLDRSARLLDKTLKAVKDKGQQPVRRSKLPGLDHCSCGKPISGNKTLCKACLDGVVAVINKTIRDRYAKTDADGGLPQ
jgi:hypothetical protein